MFELQIQTLKKEETISLKTPVLAWPSYTWLWSDTRAVSSAGLFQDRVEMALAAGAALCVKSHAPLASLS